MSLIRQIATTMKLNPWTPQPHLGPPIQLDEHRRKASEIDSASITIRPAHAGDQLALAALAALDTAEMPTSPMLIGELDGEPRAALSLSDDAVIADPFFPTVHLVELLRSYAATSSRAPHRRRSYRLRFA